MVYGCRKVDHVFERSIIVDTLAAGGTVYGEILGKKQDRKP